ncbi:mucin protein, partial [Biomphalaria glabrata]
GRTEKAETSNGTRINATIFSAFAAKEGENPAFQVKLSLNKTCTTFFFKKFII